MLWSWLTAGPAGRQASWAAAEMPSVTALRRWLVFVALLRLFSGEQGDCHHSHMQGASTVACRHVRCAPTLAPLDLRAVGLGYAAPHRFQTNLYTKQPEGGEGRLQRR